MSEASATLREKATATIVDVLRLRAETQRDEIAYRFLADGEEERGSLSYGELYRRARQIAAELQKQSAVGQRALLLDSSESDYIITFFGCLCAGVIAVPIYAPRLNKKGNARVESVVADAQPSVVLTAGAGSAAVRGVVVASAGEHVKWIDTNSLPVDGDELWTPPVLSGTDIAFLQYTSGSTAAPKGVMVSHANILHNEQMIQNAFDTKPGSVIVGWLPLYHDMGLIGNVLQPLYVGVPCVLMSPVAFLQRPLRWLQAISRYQATTSGGPNFAYELCMRKIRPEDRAGLDLSSWRVAFNGAEPVRLETLNRFAAQFADCGFRREAFVPCYGLAEATLFVSGGLDPNGVTAVNYGANGNATNGGSGNGAKISRKQDKLLVASGCPPVEQAVRIISPDSLRQCSAGEVGEIWISGPSVAQGYWRKAKETEETFNARIPEIDEGPFLRTGDLGFVKDGHLFITGRLKDLLIIRGQNYYPQDIELTVEQSHPVLQPGSGAAFSVEIEGEERLVVVQEVAVRKDPESIVQSDLDELDALIKLISRNIVAGHELQAFAIVLIRKGTIPKTSSGKIQRHACRDAFLNRELYVLREWRERELPEGTSRDSTSGMEQRPMLDELAPWLVAEIARIKRINEQRVDLQQPFTAYGLDSLDAVEFAHKLQTEFEVEVEVSEFFSDSTITEIIQRATDAIGKRVSKRETEQPARYPLSYGQRALWFLHQTAPESAAYNIARVIRIATGLDVGALRLAFQALVDRHPCLRTIVVETTGEPVQQVAEKVEVSFEYFDARDWSEAELEKVLVQQSQRPFSLTLGPLFRTVLYVRSEKEYLLHVAVHHVVADYWSLTLLLDEIGKLYQAYANKVETHLVPLEYSYADFVEWQREKLSGPAGERLRDYWKNELAGELPTLSLPADHARPPVQTFRGSSFPFNLDARLTEALKRLGEEQQATLFTTLLAAFQVLLYRLTSQKQVIVGCPIAGRSRAEFTNTAGYFVNAVPLRADFQQRQTFTEFLSQVRNRVSKAFAHELYPFSLMVEQLGIARDPAVPPIFQSALGFQQTYGSHSDDFVRFALGQPQAQVTLGGLQLEHVAVEQRTAQFDLTLTVGEGPDGIVGAWEYSSDLFDHSTVVRWSENFKVLLQAVAQHPDCHDGRIGEIEILSAAERQQLLVEWNRTEAPYSTNKCVHQLFEEQVVRTPQAVALVFEDASLSYAELNRRANQLAHYLRKMGVCPDARVGICVERGFEMIVGLLAILKAGGAYVPLDPAYPAERLSDMLADSVPVVLLTQGHLAGLFPGISDTLPLLDLTDASAWSRQPQSNPQCAAIRLMPEHLAYVIYTSGSTGQPKGVAVEHRSLCNLIYWHWDAFALESGRRSSSLAGFGFDAATWEIWPTLCVGASLMLAPPARTSDPEALLAWWKNQNIDVSFLPTPMAEFAFTRGITNSFLHTLLIGGDRLRQLPLHIVPFSLVNNYGPTETTVVATSGRIEPYATALSIGRPIANTRIYVLDKCGEPVPVGVVGELYVGGAGVARGYLNRPELTAERFLADRFSPDAATRMYRTGDLGRWLADGNIEFVGRNDFQVKIRGFRIELGEIEAKLREHPGVLAAVVIAREDTPGDKRLAAYVTTQSGDSIDIQALRTHLAAALPEYMVPAAYMQLASFPLTPNGKLDRKALPAPESDAYAAHAYEAPQGAMEATVAGIWAEMLKIERVGRNDNFYNLGGHSLLATQVMSRIRQVFGVEVPLRSFLENPTVAGLALQVDGAAKTAAPPLRPLPRKRRPRLSFAQERLWFLSRYETEASLYNVPVAVRLKGTLNVEAAKASLQEMVNRHEVLRTSFPEVDDRTMQSIAPEIDLAIPVVEAGEDELPQVLRQQARQAFDLSHGPLIRASLFRIGSQDHVLLVVLHHIVSDGWSLGIMLREFNVLYDAFSRGVASPLQPLPIQYADFSEWQREWLEGESLEKQLAYWKQQLSGLEALALPTDRPYPAKPTLAGAVEMSCLPQPLIAKLKSLSDQQGVTLFMTLLAGFKILLFRYTGCTDISVGSPIANRNRQELEPLIGFFVNTLVLRTAFAEDASVSRLLQQIREVSLQAYAHQDIPFERLVEALHPARELSRTPLFQVMFVLQNAPLPKVSWNGLEANASVLETGTAKFDLTLSAREEEGELELSLEYRTELFDADRMQRLLQHYRILLEGIVTSVDSRISEIEMLSQAERQQLLVEWNDTATSYVGSECVHELFEEQVARTPPAVALVYEQQRLSYEELNRRANQLAHYLRGLGVGPEVLVGVCLERSLEMVVALLGVLKAGGAYVPIDPRYPEERVRFMLADAQVRVLLSQEGLRQQLPDSSAQLVCVDGQWEEIARQPSDNPHPLVGPQNLAYVIYTSGSTGNPKGVMITQDCIRNHMAWMQREFPLATGDRVLQKTAFSFDASVWEFYAPLLDGAVMVMARLGGQADAEYLVNAVQQNGITVLQLVPTQLRMMLERQELDRCTSLKRLYCGGEVLTQDLVQKLHQRLPQVQVYNLYGPTEATIDATCEQCSTDFPSPAALIGRPVANTRVYVLDHEMRLAPVAVKGELYIGGVGVGRGYLKRPELTAERFVPNPFSENGERLYRTGDQVRWLDEGKLEFFGRLDQQVKVRGFRIELGEIEAALLDHPGVAQAVVVAREDQLGDKRLVGYVVGHGEAEKLDGGDLRSHLQQRLPEYMVPWALQQLDRLPLTPNGKLDRKALPTPDSSHVAEKSDVGPQGVEEEMLIGIFAEVLGQERVGIEDNFFELGGHSLLATQVVSRVRSVLGVELSLRQLFESPTVGGLAELVKRARGLEGVAGPRIERVSREQELPLSLQQEQLWFLEQITAGSTVYSLPDAVRLKGDLDKLALRVSLEEIVRRHEILRTSFVQVDDKPKQRIHETGNFDLVERDLRETANGVATEESINREQKEEAASPFLLSQPTLFRAKLLRVAEQEHILLLTFHHIVFDGWSIGVMVNELGQLYKAYHEGWLSPLPELPVQYADYAVWQREGMAEGEFVDGLEYWKKELEDLSELDLPSDHPRPAVQSFRGTVERWEMPKEASAAIRKVSQDQGVTLFMTLLAGFQILLARYSGQRDIVVGSPMANRAQPELEALIGFFVNTLVLRGNVNGDLTVEAVLQRTREVCLGAYAHQSVPFEHLVDELQPERDSSRSPLFQVMFALQNAPAGALQMHGVEISMLPSATSGAHFDLTLMVEDDPEHLRGMMEYCTDLYERPTVRRMLDHYQQVLSEIARDPGQLISTLPLLSPAERQQLLAAWNHPYAESQHKCLHELFEQQANLTPKALAVAHKGRSLTYSELNQRANQLGHYLKKLGVGSEELVGVLLPRCSELLVAMLGVLKAGAAYVVLDPDDRDQLAYILKDARPDVIVSEQGLRNKLPALSGRTVYLDAQWNESSQESEQNVEAHVHPENLAYVTYRSEGTKAPEGVAVQHGTVASLVCWAKSVLSADDLQRVLTSNPPTSDLSILDTYVPLCCGGTVVVVDDSFDGINLEEGNATLMNVTPSVMRELLGRKAVPASVRTIMLAGEPVSSGLVRKIYDNCDVKRVLNLYGHSEISLGSTIAELQPGNEDKKVSIGRPVENAQAFVLDAHMELVPAGIAGELYLSAATSARGYFHRPDLTAERLVPNVFSSGGERLFRTGELARHKANGEFELWGRVGYETRIRGHRVELEEVEKALERQPEVADAVVIIPQTGAAENKLVAYIVPQKTGATAGDALERTLRAALKQRLPEYMVPSYWATLERLPLLPDGKLDRSALPAVQPKSDLKQSASLPASDTERTVTAIWKQILKIEEVGVEDNFFDVGGQSLLIPEVHGALQKQFGTSLTIVELFQYSTIRALADRLDSEKMPSPQIAPAMVAEIIETEQPRVRTKGLAVIGMACRFPGARNIDEFWRNLQGGVESTVEFSDEELRRAGIAESVFTSPTYIKHSAILDDVDLFDARFFNMSAREAELIDPQQRALLECAWEALEDAGYSSETYKGSVGVYAGSGAPTYLLNLGVDHKAMDPNDATLMLFGNANDLLATRVAYKLNLTGPSITVQTACSTSLVTVHVAGRALLNHECDLALAGGVTIRTPQVMGNSFMEGGIVSPDGHCRTFDERAQGSVCSNGVGIVVLKRLEDALRDRDCIHAIIRGSAINNDGSQKVGFAAPSVSGQRDVIQKALRDSGVEPETISYVEAHGTATPMGDPIEVTALTQAYRISTSRKAYCAVGSVKSNIGHTDCAAGVAGLIKTVLALEHKQIPATLNFQQPNPKIDFANSPFYVNATLSEWKTNGGPRRAGVSSFGIGGTNAHVIVEEAPEIMPSAPAKPWQLVIISARTRSALDRATDQLAAHLFENRQQNFADVAFTLQQGRKAFDHRRMAVCRDLPAAAALLQDHKPSQLFSAVASPRRRPVAFLFPGLGDQYPDMARGLYESEPEFARRVDHCCELLKPLMGGDLRKIMYREPRVRPQDTLNSDDRVNFRDLVLRAQRSDSPAATDEMHRTLWAQPALFVTEFALAKLWMCWGIVPESMMGYSVGEYVTACLAGVISLEDSLRLVAARAQMIERLAPGAMLAIGASESNIRPLLHPEISIAGVNGDSQCVVAGTPEAVDALQQRLLNEGEFVCRRLLATHAFHSPLMKPVSAELTRIARSIRLSPPKIRYISNVTGNPISDFEATDPSYWALHLTQPVQFAMGLQSLCSQSAPVFLEVGPGQMLTSLAEQYLSGKGSADRVTLASLPHSSDAQPDRAFILNTLGNLWLSGIDPDWASVHRSERRCRVALPTYPFERQRYWVEAQASRGSRPDTSRRKLSDWLYLPCWKETARIPSGSEANVSENTTVLMFSDNSRMAQKLALRLEQKRYNIVTVIAGQEFAKIDHWIYTIRPAARADYDALFSALKEQGKLPEKIFHLWNVGHQDSLDRELDFAFYGPLHLVQAATAEPGIGAIQCLLLSSGLHEITGNEGLSPAKATLLGLCKTILWELPDFACKSVDIEVPAEGSWTEHSLLDQLVAELESKEQQPVVSYHRARRWIQTFDQAPLEASGPELVREGGVYLITGGLNDVGFQFAEWLASDAHAAVVLVDPRPFPSREHWDTWPATHAGDPAVEQINRIRAWERSGAKILISNADVAEPNQMRELRHQVQEASGKINGVIHAAGFSERAPIASKTRDNIAAILTPKIKGALVLDEMFAGDELDFMVFCSSLISVIGEAEQADDAAANAFLDSLAQRNFFHNRCFTLSINWDGWEEPEGTAPSAAEDAVRGGIRPAEAVEVLRRLLRAKPGPQAIISTRDLALVARRKKLDTSEEQASATGRVYARTNLDRPIDPPTNAMETLLVPIWTEVLGVSPIGIRDDFFDLGGDSLIGLRMTSRLQDLGIHVSIEQLFQHRTIQELAADIVAMNGHERPQGELAVTPTVMTVQSMLAEAVLDSVIAPNSAAVQQSPAVPGSNLLLTGASGFLGAFLLAEIMQQMPAARVHCLVRAATAQEGMRRVRERLSGFALWREEFSDRIVPLPGDIAKPSLGLSSDDFHRLANEIDTIYHNGALVNFLYPYSRLKSANVNGTSEILRLATLGSLKPVHYVSSMVVFPSAGEPGPELVNEETSLDATAGLMGGYGQSKWVAERLVRIARERGIPVTIYRPGWIAAHSRTGLGSHDDLLSRILQCSLQLGAAPDFDLELDLAPVDYVSGALVWLSRQPGSIGKTFHLLNPRTVTCSQILNWLIEAGMPVERLSLSDWFERLHRAAQNSANNAALYSLRPVFGAGASRGLDNNEAVAPQPRFDCRRTVESLAGSGWVCPPLGPEQFRLILSHLERGKEAEANGHERPQSSPVLVSIQPQGSRAPLFFVHPVGGQVICYAELSRELGLEQPFYGLQSPPANFFPESNISIEQMATLYNREIRSVQPVGPYLLGGWSMGGLVAWEMAQQLIKEGETIRLLALMDTTPPSGYLEADDRDDEISMLARFALDMSRLVGMDPQPLAEQFSQAAVQDQWKMVQETLTSYGVLAPKTAHAEMTALLDVYTRNFRAMNNYSLQISKQAAVYFRASETPERLSKPWTTWADGGIQFHSVSGDHFTMLRQPNVRIIAEALERHISANGSKESQAVSPETVRCSF